MNRSDTNRKDVLDWLTDNLVEVFLVVVLVAGIFVGTFGAANWCDHVAPNAPRASQGTAEQYERNSATYQQRLEQTGKSAVIPWVYAVPMTFAGFGLAIACVVVLIARND